MGFHLIRPKDLQSGVERPWRLYLLAVALLLVGGAVLPFDMAISRTILPSISGEEPAFHLPGDVRRIVTLSEVFAHGSGLLLIGLTVVVLDQAGRRKAVRLLTIAFSGGMLAALLKSLVVRSRPNSSDLTNTVWQTFEGWLPMGSAGYEGQSTPSGHAAQAAALAAALAWRYPRGRWLFLFFACLAASQRVFSGSHFVSDVCWGGAIGSIVAALLLDAKLLGVLFTRIETPDHSKAATIVLYDEVLYDEKQLLPQPVPNAPYVIEPSRDETYPYTIHFRENHTDAA